MLLCFRVDNYRTKSTFSSVVVQFPTRSANALLTQDVVRVKHLSRWRRGVTQPRGFANDIINKNRGSLFTMPTIIEKLKLSWERHKLSYPHGAHFSSSEPVWGRVAVDMWQLIYFRMEFECRWWPARHLQSMPLHIHMFLNIDLFH